jgi:hypothetical protein
MVNCYCTCCKQAFVVDVEVPGTITGETNSMVNHDGCLLCGPLGKIEGAVILVQFGPNLGRLRKPEPEQTAPEWWERTMRNGRATDG